MSDKISTIVFGRSSASRGLAKNSFWGLLATVFQSLFLSLFFIIIARKYGTTDFANFLIATSIYQLVVAFSSMGLGQWFIREYKQQSDAAEFTGKFLKIQMGLGLVFYLVTIGLSFILYPAGEIRYLIMILGTNIIFDNLIYAIRNLNIAEFKQKKTAIILFADSGLKFLVASLLFIFPFSVAILSMLLIVVRIITLNLFIRLGSTQSLNLKSLWHSQVLISDLKRQILLNWQFVIIGGVAIIYWRIATIMISKLLTLQDVANYEISYKLFSIFFIMPAVISSTIYPQFIRHFKSGEFLELRSLYNNMVIAYMLFAMLSYAFIYSFAYQIIPFAFGDNFSGAIECTQLMFLTFLIFPSIVLQANLIVAMRLEKMDMWFNIICLVIISAGSIIGLYFYKSLAVINYSIFFAFIIFHILQDILLVKKKITSAKNCILVYFILAFFIFIYQYSANNFNPYIVFPLFSIMLISFTMIFFKFKGVLRLKQSLPLI